MKQIIMQKAMLICMINTKIEYLCILPQHIVYKSGGAIALRTSLQNHQLLAMIDAMTFFLFDLYPSPPTPPLLTWSNFNLSMDE